MSHLKMSTISFYLLLKVSRFLNTYYNNHYLRQFTELQVIVLQDRKKKNSHTLKFPHNTIQQADLSLRCRQKFTRKLASTTQASRSLQQKKGDFLLEIYKGVSII